MYNAELKERFVSEYSKSESNRRVLSNAFGAIGKWEEKFGKDLCHMNREELSQALPDVIGYRTGGQDTRKSGIFHYIQWCVDNRVEGATLEAMSVDFGDLILDKMRRQSVANPQQLQRYLDCIFEKESEETLDVTYRCYYWLAYMGIMKEEDALSLDASNVDFEDMVIRIGDREYPFYREAIPSIRKCATLQSFQDVHPLHERRRADRTRGTALLRGFGSKSPDLMSFRAALVRKSRERKYAPAGSENDPSLNLALSYPRIWIAGRFYDMLEKERAGMSVDFTYLAEESMRGKDYVWSSGQDAVKAARTQFAKRYRRDYELWKRAYSV